jgi:DNA-binding MarR family transcriptional regulator
MIEKPQQDLTTDLGSPLELYMRAMVTQMLVSMARSLRDDALTLPQLASLHLVEVNGSMRIGEIAEQLLLPMPAASRVISDMVDRGLFERREDPTDRRAKTVSLTPAGRTLIDTISKRRIDEATHAMTGLQGGVSGRFVEFLEEMIDTGMTKTPEGAEPRLAQLPPLRVPKGRK